MRSIEMETLWFIKFNVENKMQSPRNRIKVRFLTLIIALNQALTHEDEQALTYWYFGESIIQTLSSIM
uniref:Uncharacterized protein n=1 Tax=Vespula pensylvanica TaxID=30213 RepID=A0A834UHC4_VESPE|nr:hypothetical protein H0235_001383 [Vespula pensylvanica]